MNLCVGCHSLPSHRFQCLKINSLSKTPFRRKKKFGEGCRFHVATYNFFNYSFVDNSWGNWDPFSQSGGPPKYEYWWVLNLFTFSQFDFFFCSFDQTFVLFVNEWIFGLERKVIIMELWAQKSRFRQNVRVNQFNACNWIGGSYFVSFIEFRFDNGILLIHISMICYRKPKSKQPNEIEIVHIWCASLDWFKHKVRINSLRRATIWARAIYLRCGNRQFYGIQSKFTVIMIKTWTVAVEHSTWLNFSIWNYVILGFFTTKPH